MVIVETIHKRTISSYWLLTGTFVLIIYQFLHLIYLVPEWLNLFIIFDIIWFGIGISIHYKTTKQQKISALNNVLTITKNHNQELEIKIEERTKKLVINELQLQENFNTIAELNKILQINNISLSKNVAELEVKRTLNKELGFEEFMVRFPDKESCLQLLSNLKWENGYVCDICGNTNYMLLKNPNLYARKCSRCSKVRSASANTLFHNVKFPLEKAFYILFLTTSSKKYKALQDLE